MRGAAYLGLTVTVLALCLPGCGPSHKRQALSGTVTFQGRPLQTGSIVFKTNPTPGVQVGGALIRDGQFSVPAEQGLEPGVYKVAVSSPQGVGKRTQEQIDAGVSHFFYCIRMIE